MLHFKHLNTDSVPVYLCTRVCFELTLPLLEIHKDDTPVTK